MVTIQCPYCDARFRTIIKERDKWQIVHCPSIEGLPNCGQAFVIDVTFTFVVETFKLQPVDGAD